VEDEVVPASPISLQDEVAFTREDFEARRREKDTNGSRMERPTVLGSARYGYTFRRALLLADVLGLTAAVAGTDAILELAGRGGLSTASMVLFFGLVPMWIGLAHSIDLYHLPERRVDHTFADEFGPVFLISTVWLWLCLIISAAVLQGTTELLGPTILWAVAIIAVLVARATTRRVARNRAWYRRPVLLIGDREGTDRVLTRVLRHPEWGLDVIFRLRVEGDEAELESLDGDRVWHSERADSSEGNDFARSIASVAGQLDLDRVILTGASASLSERTRLARLLTEGGHCVDYVYGEPETLYAAAVLHHLEGLPVLSVQPTRLSRGSAAMKRGLDVAGSAAALVFLSPLLAIAAVGIKLGSPGPVLFRQPRIGRDGDRFNLVKFRTMIDGADTMRADVRKQSMHSNGGGLLKVKEDPRITRFGLTLRRWSIDEVPQLWNVLRGEMSLVGPRPLPLDEAPLVKGHFEMRERVRPGMTGTWQTHGRSDIPFDDMVKLDYTYVAGWSLREDLRLLLRTVAVVARGRGTY
jgi:exopolysaccharide biosynthesis polyprenyl glycosylphosphotransferase